MDTPLTYWLSSTQALYEKFEAEGRARDQIDARKLWFAIMDAQVCGTKCAPRLVFPSLLCLPCCRHCNPDVCPECAP